ncbi:MAG: methylated-DNA--[protein]-cysteine S-methyltransferase [Acidimicrobiia bacterium]
MTFVRTTIETPVGDLTLVASDAGLRAVLWQLDGEAGVPETGDAVDDPGHPVLRATAAQLGEYFAGTRTDFDLPLDPHGTPFQQKAWEALRAIPYGETISYGEQARRLGAPTAMRAVGAANGRNPIPIIVPCHRVIGSNGSLTGFAAGIETKAWLLRHESREATLPGL